MSAACLNTAEEIVGPVAQVERLEQEHDTGFGGLRRRGREIADENRLRRLHFSGGTGTGEAMDRTRADGGRVIECAGESLPPFALAARQRPESGGFAFAPERRC